MKNKVPIKKIILTIFFICLVIWLIRNKDFSITSNEKVAEKTTDNHKKTITPTLPAEAPEPAKADEGWKTTTGADGYSWVTPVETSKPTKDLNIDPDIYIATYWILNTCVQQFKDANGIVVASFKADVANRTNHLETPTGSGNFASLPWSKSNHEKAWKNAKTVSFRPYGNEPLNLKVGRRQ